MGEMSAGILLWEKRHNGRKRYRIKDRGSGCGGGRATPATPVARVGAAPWLWKLQTYRFLFEKQSAAGQGSQTRRCCCRGQQRQLTANDIGLGCEGVHVPARKLLSAGKTSVFAWVADGRRQGLVRRIGINGGTHFGRLRVDGGRAVMWRRRTSPEELEDGRSTVASASTLVVSVS